LTTISAQVIADSTGEYSPRLTTFLLRYPRWIHAEGRTHRVLKIGEDLEVEDRTPSVMEDENLSRNASSSRAIPVAKLIQDVMDDPAVPMFWGKNQKGMQGGEECNMEVELYSPEFGLSEFYDRETAWLCARDQAVMFAKAFGDAGYHKQIGNRLLEPFSHITVVVTATQWSNFFALRRHDAAEPHIHLLADRMFDAMNASTPRVLRPGDWHLPFVTPDEHSRALMLTAQVYDHRERDNPLSDLLKLSVARCASTSYKTVEGFDMTPERAIALHDKLVADSPLHASPCEHQARVSTMPNNDDNANLGGNLGPGWVQYRKTLKGESL